MKNAYIDAQGTLVLHFGDQSETEAPVEVFISDTICDHGIPWDDDCPECNDRMKEYGLK